MTGIVSIHCSRSQPARMRRILELSVQLAAYDRRQRERAVVAKISSAKPGNCHPAGGHVNPQAREVPKVVVTEMGWAHLVGGLVGGLGLGDQSTLNWHSC